MFPSPDFVQWDQDVRTYFHERESYFIAEGVDPNDARRVALENARRMHHGRVAAREAEVAAQTKDARSQREAERKAEVERVNREWAETQAAIRSKPRSGR